MTTGTLTVTATDNRSTAAVTINGGTLSLAGNGLGLNGTMSAVTTSVFTLNPGGTLTLDNRGVPTIDNIANRIGVGATLNRSGGAFSVFGANSATSAQTFAATNLQPGNSIIQSVIGTSGTNNIQLGAVNNSSAGSSLNIIGGQIGALQAINTSNNIVGFATVTQVATNSVLPRVVVTDSTTINIAPTTVDLKLANVSGTSIVPLATYTAWVAGGSGTGVNVLINATAPTTLAYTAAADNPNSILIVGDGLVLNGFTTNTNLTVGSAGSTAAAGNVAMIAMTRNNIATNLGNTLNLGR